MYIKTASGKKFFDIPITSTLNFLKEGVALQEGIPIEEQKWIFQGKQLCDGSLPLQDYNIGREHTLLLLHQTNLDKLLTICIKTFRGEFSTQLSATVSSKLQKMILILKEKYPALPRKLQLSYKGQLLDNEDATLLDYGISADNSILYIVPKIFLHIGSGHSGKKLRLNLNEQDPNMTKNIVERMFLNYVKTSVESPPSLLTKRQHQQLTTFEDSSSNNSMFSGLKRGFFLKKEDQVDVCTTSNKKLKTEDATKCFKCNKKIGLTGGIKCKCSAIFCALHR
jgi:hypothetical protein